MNISNIWDIPFKIFPHTRFCDNLWNVQLRRWREIDPGSEWLFDHVPYLWHVTRLYARHDTWEITYSFVWDNTFRKALQLRATHISFKWDDISHSNEMLLSVIYKNMAHWHIWMCHCNTLRHTATLSNTLQHCVNGSGHVCHFNHPYECEGKQVAQATNSSLLNWPTHLIHLTTSSLLTCLYSLISSSLLISTTSLLLHSSLLTCRLVYIFRGMPFVYMVCHLYISYSQKDEIRNSHRNGNRNPEWGESSFSFQMGCSKQDLS